MAEQLSKLRNLYIEFLTNFYQQTPDELLQVIHQRVSGSASELADRFYDDITGAPRSSDFVDHDVVADRLQASMSRWISQLFEARSTEDLETYVSEQIQIGKIHARIDLPLHLYAQGVRTLKREIINNVLNSEVAASIECLQKVHELLDIATTLTVESYLVFLTTTERQTQSLKMDVVGRHLVIECERMRGSLLDWLRHTLTDLHAGVTRAPSIRESDFGLWAVHKASMLLEDNLQAQELCHDIDTIDRTTEKLFDSRDTPEHGMLLSELNTQVTQTAWKLSRISDELHEVETGRDPLTSLFNRRYLDPILKREVRYSIRHHNPFAILLIDIDLFKNLNDSHGHSAGDRALELVASIITDSVRASDVVFRYGGEEFLILLNEMDLKKTLSVAENIRKNIENTRFQLSDNTEVGITVSIGAALHDGHPDYEHIIEQTDKALYQAKSQGRNRTCAA